MDWTCQRKQEDNNKLIDLTPSWIVAAFGVFSLSPSSCHPPRAAYPVAGDGLRTLIPGCPTKSILKSLMI